MAHPTLVRTLIDEGRRVVQLLRADGLDIAVALWLKTQEDDDWHLYLAAPVIDQVGYHATYLRIASILKQHRVSEIDLTDIRLIQVGSQLAQAVVDQQAKWGEPLDATIQATWLGSTTVEEAFIYAPFEPAAQST